MTQLPGNFSRSGPNCGKVTYINIQATSPPAKVYDPLVKRAKFIFPNIEGRDITSLGGQRDRNLGAKSLSRTGDERRMAL
jgi:hypothetical protein